MFRQVLEDDYLGYKLIDGPAPEPWEKDRDHIGVHKQKDGLNYVGVKPAVGRVVGSDIVKLADIAEKYGVSRIRTTVMKELILLDVEDEKVEPLMAELDELGLSANPSAFKRGIISCTGLEFCKLALVTTRERAITLVDELEERIGDLDTPISIALNGCPNSCARTQIADIGLKGQIVIDDDNNRVEGFQVHLGGTLGMDANFGRKLRGHKVTSAELGDYVERLVNNFKEQREDGELFRQWLVRATDEDLQ